MRILKTLKYSKIYLSITISNGEKDFTQLVVPMVQSVTTGFRYYNLLVAEAITTSGQLSIRWIEKYLNNILIKFWELITRIMFLHQIQTLCILLLTSWLTSLLFTKEQTPTKKVIGFLDRLDLERKLNLY